MPEHDIVRCCVCFLPVEIGRGRDGMRLLLTRDDDDGSQELFAHPPCLATTLHHEIPFLFQPDAPEDP